MSIYRMVRQTPNSPSKSDTTAAVGANSGDDNTTPSKQSVVTVDVIPQGPTINLIDPYDQEAQRSYADVVRNSRSTHSIELIN